MTGSNNIQNTPGYPSSNTARRPHEPVELGNLRVPTVASRQVAAGNVTFGDMREYLFGRIARGEMKPLILVYGQSSSGKSSVMGMLTDAGVQPSTRLITRKPRPTDGQFEHHWSRYLNSVPADAAGATSLPASLRSEQMFSPNDVIFGIYNYGSYYATSGEELLRLLTGPETPAVSVLMGKMLDLPNMCEAIDNLIPLLPVVSLRLDVPPFVLAARLQGRAESTNGERATRLNKLMEKFVEDQQQMGSYARIYPLKIIPNILPSEIGDFGYDGIIPFTPERLQDIVQRAVKQRVDECAAQARDVVQPKPIRYNCGVVPDGVIRGLESQVLPMAAKAGISAIYAKGGFAVAAYLGDHSRRISPDIDFTVATSRDQFVALVNLHDELDRQFGPPEAGSDVSGRLQARWGTSEYHILSRKGRVLFGPEESLKELEVDGIALTRIQPGDRGFCYEFGCDHGDRLLSREVVLPNGSKLFILPPEHLVVEKLLAARGPADGNADPSKMKFDLFDVAGLISTQSFNPNLLHKLVFQQQYRPDLDWDVANAVKQMKEHNPDSSIVKVSELLTLLGYETETYPDLLLNRQVDIDKRVDGPDDNTADSTLSLTAVKHLVMLTRLEQSLDRIKSLLEEDFRVYFGMTTTMADAFGKERISEKVAKLKTMVYEFRKSQVGRGDIFVRRELVPTEDLKFFSHLAKDYPQLFETANEERA